MIDAAYSIALNTFKEAVRDRILAVFFLFAIVMMASSTILSWLTVGSELKIVTDVGLGARGVLRHAHRRVRRHQPRPQRGRQAHHLRRACQAGAALAVHRRQVPGPDGGARSSPIALMSVFYLGLVWWKGGVLPLHLLGALLLSVFEVSVVTAVAIVFSSFAPAHRGGRS